MDNSTAAQSGHVSLLPVSVVILTLNEEKNIERTLDALKSFDDVTVVDSGSQDQTVEIAKSRGASVVAFDWNGAYPKKKQWSMDNVQTNHEWVLLLDADEYPSEPLVGEIRDLLSSGALRGVGAVDLCLSYFFGGKFLTHGHRVVKRSLIDRTKCRFPDVRDSNYEGIREVEGHYQPETNFPVFRARGLLCHDDRNGFGDWIDRHNRYSQWEAQTSFDLDVRSRIRGAKPLRARIFDRVPFKPALFFFYSFVFRLGFLDGRAGLDYAVANSFYYWQIGVKRRTIRDHSA